MAASDLNKCPICGFDKFVYNDVLWNDLISAWELKDEEVKYINEQQGYCCERCHSNLRSMTLADSLLRYFNYNQNFQNFCENSEYSRALSVLEINEAGNLSQNLSKFRQYTIAKYPDVDMQRMLYPG